MSSDDQSGGGGKHALRPLKLGRGATVLDVPENRAFLEEIESAQELSPEQLLEMAAIYRDHAATASLANHLASHALAMLARSPAMDHAMKSIAKTEIEWSWLGDAWGAVKNFFTGGTDDKDTTNPCKIKCAGGGWVPVSALVEKCGKNDAWHIIGVCIFGSF